MILFPAIDLVGGKVVRLANGDRSRMDVYSDDPASVARDFLVRGATWVHVVDLSSAFGEDETARDANAQAIRDICQVEGLSVDAGGGVRSIDAMRRLASLGVAGFPVVASGGIASVADVRALAALGSEVVEGCIAGRALYEGALTLEDALAACG